MVPENIAHIATINADIKNPENVAASSPSRIGSDQEIELPSITRNQYVGTKNIQILQNMKNIWESNSLSFYASVKIIDDVGAKPTRTIAIKAFLLASTS